MQYYQFAQMYGIDPTTDTSLSQTLNQIQSQLDTPSQIGNQVLEDITNDLLIRQYAKANGIVVTSSDVDNSIRENFGYYPEGTPTPSSTRTPITYSTWSATQYALITPTITSTLSPSSTPSPTQTLDLTATATIVPSLTPTITPYTLDGYQSRLKQALSYYAKFGMTEVDFRKIYFESQLFRKRVSDLVTANVTHEQEQVWARHILVADETTALSVRKQLLAGADFGTLSAQYSIDTGSKTIGGDLGWFGTGKMDAEFESAAFALNIGEISQPVQTSNGWHIIQTLGHEIRPLTETEYKDSVTTAFNQWLTDQRTSANIVISGTWTANIPDQPNLASAFDDLYATATAYYKKDSQVPSATP
jgi:peptidyl-prolyl cis-trans isomerase D